MRRSSFLLLFTMAFSCAFLSAMEERESSSQPINEEGPSSFQNQVEEEQSSQARDIKTLKELASYSIAHNSQALNKKLSQLNAYNIDQIKQEIYITLTKTLPKDYVDAIVLAAIQNRIPRHMPHITTKINQIINNEELSSDTHVEKSLFLLALAQATTLKEIQDLKALVATTYNDLTFTNFFLRHECNFWDNGWRGKLRRLSYPLIGTCTAVGAGALAAVIGGTMDVLGARVVEGVYKPLEKKFIQYFPSPTNAAVALIIPIALSRMLLRAVAGQMASSTTLVSFAVLGGLLSHELTQRVSRIHHQDNINNNMYSKFSYKIIGQGIPYLIAFFRTMKPYFRQIKKLRKRKEF